MSSADSPERIFVIAWAFQVTPDNRAEFERAYGSHGDWVRLFRKGDGYLKTELHRDPKNTQAYITLDFWRSREQYESFRAWAKTAYEEIDAKCERLTEHERHLGDFDSPRSLQSAIPGLGEATRVISGITVRPAVAADIPAVIEIERSTATAAHWTETAYLAVFKPDAPQRIGIVAENPELRLLGFLLARIVTDECELENIVVKTGERRQGVGLVLMRELFRAARVRGIKRIFLEVRESNAPARRLYERLGFRCDGERSSYYSHPVERAILYSLTI